MLMTLKEANENFKELIGFFTFEEIVIKMQKEAEEIAAGFDPKIEQEKIKVWKDRAKALQKCAKKL